VTQAADGRLAEDPLASTATTPACPTAYARDAAATAVRLPTFAFRVSRKLLWPDAAAARGWLIVWAAGIIAASVPWTDAQSIPRWSHIAWIPYVSPPVAPLDIALNLLAFVPIGWWGMLAQPRARSLTRVVAAATALACVAEATQLWSRHSRFPSATDVVNASLGAAIGAWLTTRAAKRCGKTHP
jgi:VanZ like protein